MGIEYVSGGIYMNCWKSYYTDRKYLFNRHFFISSIISIFVFILLYMALQFIYTMPLHDGYGLLFMLSILFLYPVHKFFHIMPFLNNRQAIKVHIEFYLFILPIIQTKVMNPVKKRTFIIAILFPFMILNSILMILCILFPHYHHYFSILIALHCGICTGDFIYAKILCKAPKHSLIEENEHGFEILIKNE